MLSKRRRIQKFEKLLNYLPILVWFGTGCPFAFRSLASALSVGGSGGVGMSTLVGLVGSDTGLHNPTFHGFPILVYKKVSI